MIRILIIDDHEMVREGLKTILAPEPDFEVVGESGTADRLVEMVERAQPNIVLLDARLPGLSGPDACRRLRAAQPDVPVLIVTTFTDDDLVDDCIRAGAKGYVVKDVERFDLKRSIRAVVRGESVISPSVAGGILERTRSQSGASAGRRPALNSSQFEILRLVSEGFSNREIAAKINLSENTVKSHLQEIFRKLEVRNRVEAALLASREGWI
jgi:two-component system, NarL family, response regulator DevR